MTNFATCWKGTSRAQRLARKLLIGFLFGCSGLMVVLAFLSMGPSRALRKASVAPDFSSDEG